MANNTLKVKRQLRETRDQAIRDFTNGLSFLASAALSKNKRDDDFQRRFDEFSLAKRDAPEGVLKIAGPPLWDFREDIKAGNVDRFLKSDFKDEIVKYADGRIPNSDLIEEDQELINKIKRSWHLFTPAEQGEMVKRVQGLVANYAQYLASSKKLREMGDHI